MSKRGDDFHPPPGVSTTSMTLVERVKLHDAAAWRRFLHLYGPLVFQWCRRTNLNAEDAADISQEVFQTVMLKIGDFRRNRPGDSLRGWLYTITRNKIGDLIRKQDRQPPAAGGTDAYRFLSELPEQLPDDAAENEMSTELVHRALELVRPEFEPRTWQAFWRTAVQGQAPKEVAAELGVTPDAIRVAKSRVLRRLREELPDFTEGDRGLAPPPG
jgi:RNA polymerase sigma-70 factor (ECF subfamily)